jgi:REP element-mobilizing transposase RayT
MAGDQPLAYFITFTAYGTRLHGDERGSVDRVHNLPGTPVLEPDSARVAAETALLMAAPVILGPERRKAVRRAIVEHCDVKGWRLFALNVRTNHVHVVVRADIPPERVFESLKAWATRRLVSERIAEKGARVWTRHASTRYLWTERDVEDACTYVVHGQGDPLPGSET